MTSGRNSIYSIIFFNLDEQLLQHHSVDPFLFNYLMTPYIGRPFLELFTWFLPAPRPHCFSFCGFIIIQIKGGTNHQSLFLKFVLATFGSLLIHVNFNISSLVTMESPVVNFIGNMDLYINLKVSACFMILSFFIQWHGVSISVFKFFVFLNKNFHKFIAVLHFLCYIYS